MTISAFYCDSQSGNWWAAMNHKHWGQKLFVSGNEGRDWQTATSPVYPKDAQLSDGKPAVLKKIWTIGQSTLEGKQRIWVGTQPGGLFYSDDKGSTFHLVEGLWNHPSRKRSDQWFGAGGNEPFIHTIAVDPRDAKHIYIAVSSAGVFETWDYGLTWTPRNNGLIAAYLPDHHVEVGHDPHGLLICEANPDVLWQQNHCGIFRSADAGANWQNVTDENGIADYGFAMVIDHADPNRAWVIPVRNDVERVPHDLALCVCRTDDGGHSWQAIREGLPQEYCFDIVFRHSFAIAKNRLAFGTTTGNLYVSEDKGESWNLETSHLQRIENVTFL
jgi:photosystem II stability/assembly factor-like uncharacterized protein